MDAKEEVRSRLDIEEVIGEYVQLKRAGRNWKGLSPFGAEKTPSFVVSPDKGIWHDFSSGRGGDMFSFVMEVEGLDFRGALELLARRAGIDLDQYKQAGSGTNAKTKERLYEALELATKFYQTQFTQNKTALEYVLKKRAFSKETALEWRLGYSPNNGSALVDFLKNKRFTQEEIKAAGLTNQRGSDMFRGRLQIPLCDTSGRVVGFTARLLADDPQAPKYINTPATALYDKSRHVFGLHLAKEAIRKTKFVVLAEGNLDVIASHQVGVRQVVAIAGTALTEPHLKALSRLTGDIRLCFDADKAGINATERAIPVAGKVGVSLQIITIPNGKDPDELIRSDAKVWQDIITKPQYAVDWLIDRYEHVLDLNTAVGKREFSDVVLRTVRQLPDSVEQDHYIGTLAEILSVNKQALETKLASDPTDDRPVRQKVIQPAPETKTKEQLEHERDERHLLALTLLQPALRKYLYNLGPDMFSGERSRELFEFLVLHPDFKGADVKGNLLQPDQGDPELARDWQKIADYAKIIALVYETDYSNTEAVEQGYTAAKLRSKITKRYFDNERSLLAERQNQADPDEAFLLLKKTVELNKLERELNQEDI